MARLEGEPPKLEVTKVPESERDAVEHVSHLLTHLALYELNFHHAVLLFDACDQARRQIVGTMLQQALISGRLDPSAINLNSWAPHEPVIGGWQEVAARDGVMTIYNFGGTVDAIKNSLPVCPSLKVDYAKVRLAHNLFFKGAFRNHEDIRHVLAHSAKFHSSLTQRKQHAHTGPFMFKIGNVGMEKKHPSAVTQMTGSLIGNAYMVTFAGKPYGYQITTATAAKLDSIRKLLYSAISIG
jgi:hypothetical protein